MDYSGGSINFLRRTVVKYLVNYFNLLEGGSGQTEVSCDLLHEWLASRPGTVIRELIPHSVGMTEYSAFRKLKADSIIALSERLIQMYS